MENVKNKQRSAFHFVFAIGILLLLFVSCKSNSYLDILTGESIRFWQDYPDKDYYMSFDKRTRRIKTYDSNLKRIYGNCLEIGTKGMYFRISGTRVFTSWRAQGKIPSGSFELLEINDNKLILKRSYGNAVTLIKYNRYE